MPKPNWWQVLKLAGVILLAYLFTLQVVHYSRFHGRLATVPGYDDVAYLYSGLDLALALHEKGFAGWADHFGRLACHAPYSEILAGLTFYLHGWSYRQAYVANVFLVVAYLLCLLYFFKSLKTYVQFALFGCFLALPFASMVVAEFRPDMAWATVLGFTTVYQVTRRDYYEKLSPCVACGLLTGLSFLAKPSTFAMTLLICLLAFGARLVLEFYRPTRPQLGRLGAQAAVRLLIVTAITIVLCLPYAYYFGRGIWEYFIFGVFGVGRKVFDAFAHHPWNYYIYGPAYDSNFAITGDILIILTLALLFFVRKSLDRYDKTELELCLLLILVPYVISIKAPIVSPFLGGCFYGTMIFVMAYVFARYGLRLFKNPVELHRVETNEGGSVRKTHFATLTPAQQSGFLSAFVFLMCLLTYAWPPYSDSGDTGRYMRHLHRKLSDYFDHAPVPATICLTQASPIARENVLIWLLVRTHHTPFVETSGLALSVDEAWKTIEKDDLIITQDTGFKQGTPWLPCEKLQDQIVARLMSSPDYHLMWKVGDGSGKFLYVFRRDQPAPAQVFDPGPV